MTNDQGDIGKVFDEQVVRILEIQESILAVNAAYDLTNTSKEGSTVLENLYHAESRAWRDLFMWGIVVDKDRIKRLRVAGHARFLSRKWAVDEYLEVSSGKWFEADEKKFRKMAAKCFLEEKNG